MIQGGLGRPRFRFRSQVHCLPMPKASANRPDEPSAPTDVAALIFWITSQKNSQSADDNAFLYAHIPCFPSLVYAPSEGSRSCGLQPTVQRCIGFVRLSLRSHRGKIHKIEYFPRLKAKASV